MKDRHISGNTNLNALINRALCLLCEEDQRRFLKHFREQPATGDQVMHTTRELILGAYLASNAFNPRYHLALDGQTPDGSLFDRMPQVRGIVDLINLHIDKRTENQIEQQRRARGRAVYWRDANKDNISRLRQWLAEKADCYQGLVEKLDIPYVVSVFGDFRVDLDDDDIARCLFEGSQNFFETHRHLSGVLHISENSGQYAFRYTPNPEGTRQSSLPNGVFPPPEAPAS